jgi:hypothetical protein
MLVALSPPARAQSPVPAPSCTDVDRQKIQVELDGIEALRKHGIAGVSLNALCGVCTAVRSVEGSMSWITEPVIKSALELLKSQGYDFGDDTHILASLCTNVHEYTDEFAVGKRERELKEKLARCK